MRVREARVNAVLVAVLATAFLVRGSFSFLHTWEHPYTIHNGDESMLPLEAVAWWEGVTPAEVGWPASTTRLLLGSVYAIAMVVTTPSVLPLDGQSFSGALNVFSDWTRAQWRDPS